jgi:hypothetical protein
MGSQMVSLPGTCEARAGGRGAGATGATLPEERSNWPEERGLGAGRGAGAPGDAPPPLEESAGPPRGGSVGDLGGA